ncbi:MAG TPA: response regulator [Desulfobacterales bacterium]
MAENVPSKKRTILLVEPNDFIKDALRRSLEIEDFIVDTAPSATEGLRMIKLDPFDIIIADYELMDLNGLDFFLLTQRIQKDSHKILMTTYGELKTLSDIRKYGIDDAIEKPFPFDQLIHVIERNLARTKNDRVRTTGRPKRQGGVSS